MCGRAQLMTRFNVTLWPTATFLYACSHRSVLATVCKPIVTGTSLVSLRLQRCMADTNIKLEQARLLYGKCDRTGKGYLTREDMHRLKPSLPLTAEQLDAVFDSLDQDEDERLTFEEFFEGIGRLSSGYNWLFPTTCIILQCYDIFSNSKRYTIVHFNFY